jgi:hypothetical protein
MKTTSCINLIIFFPSMSVIKHKIGSETNKNYMKYGGDVKNRVLASTDGINS